MGENCVSAGREDIAGVQEDAGVWVMSFTVVRAGVAPPRAGPETHKVVLFLS